MIHSVLAAEAGVSRSPTWRGAFTPSWCAATRTCSVTVEADTPDAVVTNWEQIKKDEKGHGSLVEGITPGLPSLLYVQKLLRKAARSVSPRPTCRRTVELRRRAGRRRRGALGAALAALAAAGASRASTESRR